jgi:hypothetical protein
MSPEEAIAALEGEMAAMARRLGATAPTPAKPAVVQAQSKDTQASPAAQVGIRKTLTKTAPVAPTMAGDPNDLDKNFEDALHWFKTLD